jgi:uncharacterized LabA/DUF88 family protein
MKEANAGDHLAVLIDADNVSSKIVAGLMAEVANYGTASVRRIYGDWTSPNMKSWRECLLEHSIVPIQQFAYTTGKNATDGAMIIDAMDLLYTGRFSSFCLVSSDSDFTRLAARIREQGISVYGFGNRHNTHRAFVAACNEFIYFDSFLQEERDEAPATPSVPEKLSRSTAPSSSFDTSEPLRSLSPRKMPPRTPSTQQSFVLPLRPQTTPGKRPIDCAMIEGLKKAISSSNVYEDDFVNLTEVGTYLVNLSPDLNARNYGFPRLKELILATDIVELKMKKREPAPPIALVRLRH